MSEFFKSTGLLLVMLNPFLLIVYLTGIVQKLDQRQFTRVLVRAGLIASTVFCGFAILGDAIFVRFMHVEFASFQIFGGVVFLLIALQFVIACLVVITAMVICVVTLALLKKLHDIVLPRREALVQRYIEIAGRVMALIVGTIAIDMIMRGLSAWLHKF
ncbi:MAG: MarC family protein [Gammaproteobacteria bacterium]